MFSRRTLALLAAAVIIGLLFAAQRDASAQEGETYQVQPGDTCWGVAERFFGNGADWNVIRDANPAVVRQVPNNNCLWYPGELTKIPPFTSAGTVPTTGGFVNPASPSIQPGLFPASNQEATSASDGSSSWDFGPTWPVLILFAIIALLVGIIVTAAILARWLYVPNSTTTYVEEIRGQQSTTHTEVERHEGGFNDRTEVHVFHHFVYEEDDEDSSDEHAPATTSTNGAQAQPEHARFGAEPEH